MRVCNKCHLFPPLTYCYSYYYINYDYYSRIYPAGTRVNSSNLDPMGPWSAGNQMVALNYQTEDASMLLNHGLFLQNGQCGYVLKPRYMRELGVSASGALAVQVHVIGGAQLPQNSVQATKSEVILSLISYDFNNKYVMVHFLLYDNNLMIIIIVLDLKPLCAGDSL